MAKQAKNTGRNWYVIHTYSGYEHAVREALLQRIESMNMQDKIFDVVVPEETQIVIKNGKPKTEKKRLFPGYVLVDMDVNDESWYVVRNTPNVTGFVGSGVIPVPVSGEEWKVVRRHMGETDPKFKIDFQTNDHVVILDGPFANYDGIIQSIDKEKGKVKILITIFGRETPVELDFTQIKKK
ncbi:MAG: transcription termination/antitermination factor NusG, transcriptional antiterminator NusG [Candidatus Peregrinibacteria bacterium GW2011_GWE2_39_6]|nr:MAG: transcription termination/antitermination factor NusG, transcriptional antiterminator NusG [Candidatus Peregrinibacteria bacterium GW2011_GWF2_39_17]KKR25639.1 MAG: transcription termination/antitermination factor NusG, transcriptional antiterminator NusG [Candidatus Peregrinibacteria bacterium GW2011_GWE2_39_6]HCW32914.1 transcription termination/antitermination protein NusG [Candidatus Peregrinibacteria bacterium]